MVIDANAAVFFKKSLLFISFKLEPRYKNQDTRY
jgi:hypothetical protein